MAILILFLWVVDVFLINPTIEFFWVPLPFYQQKRIFSLFSLRKILSIQNILPSFITFCNSLRKSNLQEFLQNHPSSCRSDALKLAILLEIVKISSVQLGKYPFLNVLLLLLKQTRSPTRNLNFTLDLTLPCKLLLTKPTLSKLNLIWCHFYTAMVYRVIRGY